MEAGTPPIAAAYPSGYPGILAAGPVVSLLLFIPGEPVPQSRPRGRVREGKNGPFVQFYEERTSTQFKEHVAEVARFQVLKTPVVEIGSGKDFLLPFADVRALIKLRFNLRKPVSYPKRIVDHTKKPDFDNLAKGVVDGLVQGGILKDDNCVTDATIQKRYADDQHPEGVEIDLTVMPTES